MPRESAHSRMIELIGANAEEILREHNLGDDFVVVKELKFSRGRVDLVIYGLCRGLCIIPIAIEVKGAGIVSAADLLNTINEKMRGAYDYAFTHVYLATSEIRHGIENLARRYLSELGYGLIIAKNGGIDVAEVAKPKRPPGSEYYKVASRGLLYLAVKHALEDLGFRVDHISSEWIGFRKPINYCGWLTEKHAVFGIYATNIQEAKKLLEAVDVAGLAERGYRIFIEVRYIKPGAVIGVLRLYDETINYQLKKTDILELMKALKAMYRPCGVGIGVYKVLWDLDHVPSYPWALAKVKECLSPKEMGTLKNLMR